MNLFVYGTLRFGDVRWKFLEPFVVDEGAPDTVAGDLFDTGAGYPAAIFSSGNTIIGHRYELLGDREDEALQLLDAVESAVTGLYHRIRLTTEGGVECWAYQYGLGVDDPVLSLHQINSGDWFQHQAE